MVSVESTLSQAASSYTELPSVSPLVGIAGIKAASSNLTSLFLPPSTDRLLRSPLRVLSRIDRTILNFWNRVVLEGLGRYNIFGIGGAGTGVAGTGAQAMADVAAQPGVAQAIADIGTEGWAAFFADAFQASTFKGYWGMLHYLTSRWAFTCFAIALILNRIGVYGASRQRVYLSWTRRLALRIIPILLLVGQIEQLLQAIRCQTSPEFSLYRHGDINKYTLLDWSKDGGFLHTMSSTLLLRSTDADACAAVGMGRPSPEVRAPHGSFSLLWPSFLKLALSHVVEGLSCSLQQVPTMTEVGMSVFEHSLAFAEAETALHHTLGLGLFGAGKPSGSGGSNITASDSYTSPTISTSGTVLALVDATASLTGPHLLDRINVPVEVLLVTLLSCGNALTSHIIAVLGKQRQWRLVNTGIWGITFMASFVWGLLSTSMLVRSGDDDDRPVSNLLHFPTVAIVGFLPHMVILLSIGVCFLIYLVALTFTAVSLGTNPGIPQPTTLRERFSIAHDNLQVAVQTRGINIRWSEDFYTALLRVGFAALTAASEAVFLNEGRSVEVRQFTWLEEDRLDEFESAKGGQGAFVNSQQFQILEEYGLPPSSPGGTDKGGVWESGYSRERKFDKKEGELEGKDSFLYPTPRSGGVGAVQRTTRFYLLMIYLRGIIFLVAGYVGFGFGLLLDYIGITARPRWLRKLVGRSLKEVNADRNTIRRGAMLDFWLLTGDGRLAIPKSDEVDIETEMRRRLMTEFSDERVDELLDMKLYDWWRSGGWFGTKDDSGEYQPSHVDDFDDTTSMISMSTEASVEENEEDAWESEPEGQKTPTQSSTEPQWSFSGVRTRESTPGVTESGLTDSPLDAATLARLLNPRDRESREEARILASHLASVADSPGSPARIMTRSRYRREVEGERARVLLAGRADVPGPAISLYDAANTSGPRPLTAAEEAEILEGLLLARRQRRTQVQTGGDDESVAGPPCVVCQTAPRTIIAWPCRCLIVCEDCRVSLALNNFGNCVTCRRAVQGFVRLYVP